MAAADGEPLPNSHDGLEYLKQPSFIKVFCVTRNMDNLRLPPKWVANHGGDLPFQCRLVMPNGTKWSVRLLRIENGCHFWGGWAEFVADNCIQHHDYLTFTLVDVGTFHVKRYDFGSGCPLRDDYELVADDEILDIHSPDIYTSDDYEPSESEIDTEEDYKFVEKHDALQGDGYLTFVIALTMSNIKRTLEISFGFWAQHICMASLQVSVFFTVEDRTWEVVLRNSLTKIWVKRGWRHFKQDNALIEGVRCTFQLVDPDEPQFYVSFDRP
ncbi:B3 domain-containing protein REM1-like [Salvia divinorum]|uniref:B3 domain-containing protein REM1-like n=1 Tax=Salvia divinorum TaxID=28513 RepID=A0ABD1HS15_SALDI